MQALIIGLLAGVYTIYDFDTKVTLKAKARGKFRQDGTEPKVGDHVQYEMMNQETAYIIKVAKRTNDLIRPAIANIDQALLVFSVKEPDFNPNLLDSFLAILEFHKISCTIVFSKWDLLTLDEAMQMDANVNYYHSLGYPVLKTTIYEPDSDSLQLVKDLINGRVLVLAGQSGVGKSSLINEIAPGLDLKTAPISQALGRGKHTTRQVELIPLFGGWLADTPGFGLIDFDDMSKVDLAHSFSEFFKLSKNCKYNGCLHLNEPHCAVKDALAKGEILASRYENYCKFIASLDNKRKW